MFGKLNVHNLVAEMEEKKACHLVVVLAYNSQSRATTQLLRFSSDNSRIQPAIDYPWRHVQRLGPLQNGSCSSISAQKV
jgi:hypothetical protein